MIGNDHNVRAAATKPPEEVRERHVRIRLESRHDSCDAELCRFVAATGESAGPMVLR